MNILKWGRALSRNSGRFLGGTMKYGAGAFGVYAGGKAFYEYEVNDQAALLTWGNMFLGKKTLEKAKTEGGLNVVGDFFLGDGNTDKVVEKGKDLVGGVGDVLKGTGEGSGGLFGGLSNLVSGIFGGGVSSIVGLIAAGMMFFGNFGWMGKIVCGLIAAMCFGLFGGNNKQQTDYYTQQPEGNNVENDNVVYRARR